MEMKNKLTKIFDDVSATFVMAEPDDHKTIRELLNKLASLSKLAIDTFNNTIYADSVRSSQIIETILSGKSENPASDFEKISNLLSGIQAEINAMALYPHTPNQPGEKQKETSRAKITPIVDKKIFEDFIARQDSVMEELEKNILSIEKQSSPDAIHELRRIIHTLKGEASVLDLDDIEKICHSCEEYINASSNPSADVLLIVKDWLNNAVAYYGGSNVSLTSTDVILSMLSEIAPACQTKTRACKESSVDDPSLIADFICESHEHLDTCETNLLILESDTKNKEAINCVFRSFHTIKGLAGFLAFNDIAEIAHKTENLLSDARKEDVTLSDTDIDDIFKAVDTIRTLIAKIDKNPDKSQPMSPIPQTELAVPENSVSKSRNFSNQTSALVSEYKSSVQASTSVVKDTVKVDTGRLDRLVDAVGELVIASSMVCQDREIISATSGRVNRNLTHLAKLTRELQDIGMSMRMVPIRSTFQKMARLIRDLSKEFGKPVDFRMTGEDTELDRSVVEQLGDPLIHLMRNAIDHGIEDVAERRKTGKPEIGRIELRAFHKSGCIYIEIEDDGKGLDSAAILDKAHKMGIIADGHSMTDKEIFDLIFHPGFSTAKKVTNVSGRGVGMDVVKRSIENLRGHVEISSVPGKGSVFSLRLPLTLAVIDGLVISVGKEKYIVPTLSVVTTFRPKETDISTALGRCEMFYLQKQLLPLFRLYELFNSEEAKTNPMEALIVIVEDNGKKIGLLVDKLLGQQQVVIKTLGESMQGIAGIAGGAIMPDGRVGLIVDVAGLTKMATENI